MATHSLNSSINVGITLTTSGNDRSPFTVTTHGTIDTTGSFGVYSTINSPSLINEGFISADEFTNEFGVFFEDGGSVYNSGTKAAIVGSDAGIFINGGFGTILNEGTVSGDYYGVQLEFGGTVTNTGTSSLIEGNIGVASDGPATIINQGTISGVRISDGYGINLSEGGYVKNSSDSALIVGNEFGIKFSDVGSVANAGTIKSSAGYGIYLIGGEVTNIGTASQIYGDTGIYVRGNPGSVTNTGTIEGVFRYGVFMQDGGTVTNHGLIFGGSRGVIISSQYKGVLGSVTNYGSILTSGVGVAIYGGGTLTNSGTISGGSLGVYLEGIFGKHDGTVDNSGLINDSRANVSMTYSRAGVRVRYGAVYNSGTITATGGDGVDVYGGGTVTNSGIISGRNYLAVYFGKGVNRLIVDPGAVFDGVVSAYSLSSNTLELAAGRAATLAGVIGRDFVGFTTLAFDEGASWSVTADVAALTEGELITGFAPGDTIDLADVAFTRTGGAYGAAGEDTYTVATAGTLTLDADGSIYKFDITGAAVGQHDFVLGGDDLTITEVACYVTGTRIATSVGEVPVEDLIIGDLVETRDAGLRPVKWIGRRRYDGRFIKGNKDALPVCIKQGALGKNVPARDLWVSPGHAVCVDGALVHAFRLVNGVSVVQAEAVESVAYYHVELDSHEVMFAENCPAESFFDEDFRGQFQNAAEYEALYPGRSLAGRRCLPRLEDGFALEALRQRVNAQAGIAVPVGHGRLRGFVDEAGPDVCTGWAQDVLHPELPVSLDVFVGGVAVARVLANGYRADLRDAGLGSGCHGFRAVLSAGLRGVVEVRRAVDGAALALTVAARALAA